MVLDNDRLVWLEMQVWRLRQKVIDLAGAAGGAVSSVFGRTGAVSALQGDYAAFYSETNLNKYFAPTNATNLAANTIPISSGTAYASDALYFRPTRNTLGIAYADPTITCHVAGTMRVSTDGSSIAVGLSGQTPQSEVYKFGASSGDILFNVGSSNQWQQFQVADQTAVSFVTYGILSGGINVGDPVFGTQKIKSNQDQQYIILYDSASSNAMVYNTAGNAHIWQVTTTEYMRLSNAGKLTIRFGLSTSTATAGGSAAWSATTAGNTASANDTTLFTYTVPASALGTNGDTLDLEIAGSKFVASATSLKLKWGSETLTTITGPIVQQPWRLRAKITRWGATQQKWMIQYNDELPTTHTIFGFANQTLSNTNVLEVTGQHATTANNVIAQFWNVNILHAP